VWKRAAAARQGDAAPARRGSPVTCGAPVPLCVLCIAAASVLGGCGQPKGVLFEPLAQPVVWPQPPEPARIAYVGSLATDEDLKPGTSFGEAIGELLFGRRDARAMVTPYAIATDGPVDPRRGHGPESRGTRVFIADSNARLVHVFNLETRRYEQWRPGKDRYFGQPVGIVWHAAIDGGRLYVADSAAGVVHCFDGRGNHIKQIGEAVLMRPCGLAVDPQRNRLYVADAAQHQVIVLDGDGRLVARLGERGTSHGQFNFPTNVAVDHDGRLYVSDSLNFRVQVFDRDLDFVQQIGRHGDRQGYFAQPKGIALDRHGHLYVVDSHFEAVQIFDRDGRLLLSFGEEGRMPGQFWLPAGVHVGADGRIWVADTYNRRVQVFQLQLEVQP
jgi:sugar lactone lactonase YvrE